MIPKNSFLPISWQTNNNKIIGQVDITSDRSTLRLTGRQKDLII